MSGGIRRLYDLELEPEVRGRLDSLSDGDFKRVDEVCGMLAAKGTELGGPWSDHLEEPGAGRHNRGPANGTEPVRHDRFTFLPGGNDGEFPSVKTRPNARNRAHSAASPLPLLTNLGW